MSDIFVKGDINDPILILDCLNSFKPDIIVNFAAETHVDRSIEGPKLFYDTNVLGTHNLIHSLIRSDVCSQDFRFVHISTDEVFGSIRIGELLAFVAAYNEQRFTSIESRLAVLESS